MKVQSLEYKLLGNHLQKDKTYMPRVINQTTVNFESILKEMEKNTAIRRADLRLAINQFMNTLTDILARGEKAVTPLGIFSVVLQGRFDSFDEELKLKSPDTNHKLRLQWITSGAMKQNVTNNIIIIKNIENRYLAPDAHLIKNISVPESDYFAPKHVFMIKGANLKFDEADEEQGVYWVDSKKQSFKNVTVVQNQPRKLVLQVPSIPPGLYKLEMHTRVIGTELRNTVLYEKQTVGVDETNDSNL